MEHGVHDAPIGAGVWVSALPVLAVAVSVAFGFLVPVFFVYSGLNTRIGLLATPGLWALALLVLAIAIAGKGLACMAAARAAGEAWRDALAIGVLMNARGLMELIILNIGLERGVITPTLFTIMVVMALVTTLMASPPASG